MRALYIVNPAAGHGQGSRRWAAVEHRALARAPGSRAWKTMGPGDAARLVCRGLEQGFEALIAVGGDGTAGEVVDGYLGSPEAVRRGAVLGHWPVGSGCDLARGLGIGGRPEDWLLLLSKNRIRKLDAGVVDFAGPDGTEMRRRFLNVVSLGLGGEVARRVRSGGKPWGGTLSYLAVTLSCLAGAKPYPLDLTVDGAAQPSARYHLIAVANTGTTGGGMRIAPQADPEDGFLDLVTIGPLSRWELLRRFPLIYTGGHLKAPGVAHRRIRRLRVRSDETVHLNIDGEALGTLPAAFNVLPAAVPLLCPAE